MRKFNLSAIVILSSFISTFLFAEDTKPKKLNLSKINSVMLATLAEFVDETKNVSAFSLKFDLNHTSFEKDIYGMDYAISLDDTGWGAPVKGMGKIIIQAQNQKADNAFSIMGITKLKTDVVAYLVHKTQKVSSCSKSETLSGLKEVLLTRHCERVAALSEVKNIGQLGDFLEEKIQFHQSDVKKYILELEDSLTLEGIKPEVIKLLQSELNKSKLSLKSIENIKIVQTNEGFKLTIPKTEGCPIFGQGGFEIVATAEHLLASGLINLNSGRQLYVASKPIYQKILAGLQSEEEFAKTIIKLDAQFFVNWITQK